MTDVLAGICLVVLFALNAVSGDDVACDPQQQPRIMTDPTGWFASPNFPFNYPENADCQWQIEAQPGQVVRVDFTAFDTERSFDTVWFVDGTSTLAPAIIGVSGTISPPPSGIHSPKEVVYIWFATDEFQSATGFNATYTSVDIAGIQDACSAVSRPLMLTGSSGTFASQLYPNPYPFLCECQWLITSQEADGVVQLDFTSFNTQGNSDWILIYDGSSASDTLVARISGQYSQAPTGFRTTRQFMFVRFAATASNSFRGFQAVYTSVPAA